MNYLIKFLSILVLGALPFLANSASCNKAYSSLENEIKTTASKYKIEDIKITSFADENSIKLIITYDGKKKEIIFTKDEIERANDGHFLPSTVKKINEIFDSNNHLNVQPGGGGPIQ
ncbi:hypothetical protein SCO70_02830 [Legionella pneumophila serogroup 3]